MTEISNLVSRFSEEAFAGCVIETAGDALHSCPASIEHFVTVGARTIFAAALLLYRAGHPVSQETVLQRLGSEEIERIGGNTEAHRICWYVAPSEAAYHFDIISGKLALRKASEIAKWIGGEVASTKEPGDFCRELQGRVARIETDSDSKNVLDACCGAVEASLDRFDAGRAESGFKTGLPGWDKAFGGVMEGGMYALAGRPGVGKTAYMEGMIGKYLSENVPVSVFEKDMSPVKLVSRLACRAVGVPYWAFARGLISREQSAKIREFTGFMRQMPLHLHNPASLTAEKFCSIARRDIRTGGAKAVFLDHVQALRVGKDLREGLTQASLAIRANVTDTGIPHIVLAHINRDGAKGKPSPENIKEFDQLYGDCDGMAILWADSMEPVPDEQFLRVNFFAAKNRDGGQSNEEILFDGPKMKFHSCV